MGNGTGNLRRKKTCIGKQLIDILTASVSLLQSWSETSSTMNPSSNLLPSSREGRKEGQEIEFKHQRSKQPCPCKEASIKTLKDGVPGWGASGDWGAQGALTLHAPPHINLYHLAIPGLHSL